MILDYDYTSEDEFINKLLMTQNDLMKNMNNETGENYIRTCGKIEGIELAIQHYLWIKCVK